MDHNPLAGWLDGGDGAESSSPGERERPESAEQRSIDTGARPPRRRRLLLLAAVPWVVVLALVAMPPSDRIERDARGDAPARQRPTASQPPRENPVLAPTPVATPDGGFVPPESLATTHGAHAALAVRNALTLAAGEHGPASYVDFVAPETSERVGPHTVVTVLAVILRGDAGGWRSTRVARYAVPLFDGREGPRVVGRPWPVAIGDVGRPALRWSDADGDHGAVVAALEEAGFSEVGTIRLDGRHGVPQLLRARFVAAGPAEPSRRRHVVWLSTEPAIRVLGYP